MARTTQRKRVFSARLRPATFSLLYRPTHDIQWMGGLNGNPGDYRPLHIAETPTIWFRAGWLWRSAVEAVGSGPQNQARLRFLRTQYPPDAAVLFRLAKSADSVCRIVDARIRQTPSAKSVCDLSSRSRGPIMSGCFLWPIAAHGNITSVRLVDPSTRPTDC